MHKLVGGLIVLDKDGEQVIDKETLVELTDACNDGTIEISVDLERPLPAKTTVFVRVKLADIVAAILKERGTEQ